MKIIFVIIFVIISSHILSQRLEIQQCGAYYLSYIEVPSPYSKNSYSDVGILQIAYFQKIRKNFYLGLRASYYDPFVSFNIDDYPYSNIISVAEASGTFFNLTFLTYYKYAPLRRLHINSYFGINNSYYLDYYGLNSVSSLGNNIDGETNIQGTYEEKGFKGFQFRPEISLGIEWFFLKYFSLEINVAYIQGTKRIQELEIRYTLKDSEEYFGKTYSNGSMWVPSIGLSFYLGGYSKNIRKVKRKYNAKKKRRIIYK